MPVKPRSHLDPSSRTRGCAQLDRHIPAYRQYFADRGNAAGYALSCEAAVLHLSMWMKGTKKNLNDIDEVLVAAFVDEHLPGCHCATSARYPSSVRAALNHLLVVLRAVGAIAPAPLDMTEVGEELRRYDQYMEQGLDQQRQRIHAGREAGGGDGGMAAQQQEVAALHGGAPEGWQIISRRRDAKVTRRAGMPPRRLPSAVAPSPPCAP